MAFKDWSSTAGSNSSIGGVSVIEGMSPSGVNNAIRALMADLASEFQTFVNVRSYGADRTGVSDSTSAFTSALSALSSRGGGVLVVDGGPSGPGTFKLSTVTTLTDAPTVFGYAVDLPSNIYVWSPDGSTITGDKTKSALGASPTETIEFTTLLSPAPLVGATLTGATSGATLVITSVDTTSGVTEVSGTRAGDTTFIPPIGDTAGETAGTGATSGVIASITKDQGYAAFQIRSRSNVTIDGLRFDGSSAYTPGGLGYAVVIRFRENSGAAISDNILLRRLKCLNMPGNALFTQIAASSELPIVKNLTVQDSYVEKVWQHGIGGSGVTRGKYTGNIVLQAGLSDVIGLGLDASSGHMEAIANENMFIDCGNGGMKLEAAWTSADTDLHSSRVVACNNVLYSVGESTNYYAARIAADNVVFEGNIIDGYHGSGFGMILGSAADFVRATALIKNNIVRNIDSSDQAAGIPFELYTNYNTAAGNTVTEMSGTLIEGNVFDTADGSTIIAATGVNFIHNIFKDVTGTGIRIRNDICGVQLNHWDHIVVHGNKFIGDMTGIQVGDRLMTHAVLDSSLRTAQAGTTTSITLHSGESSVDDFYTGALVTITSGTSSGSTATILDYNGTTKVATTTTFSGAGDPDNTSVYLISSQPTTGTAQAGAASTITLASNAPDIDDFFNGQTITLTGGTGGPTSAGITQQRTITDYVGSTKVATVATAWATNPDNTTTYSITSTMGSRGVTVTDNTFQSLGNQLLNITTAQEIVITGNRGNCTRTDIVTCALVRCDVLLMANCLWKQRGVSAVTVSLNGCDNWSVDHCWLLGGSLPLQSLSTPNRGFFSNLRCLGAAGHVSVDSKVLGDVCELPRDVSLTGDAQTITVSLARLYRLSSDNGTAGNRTFLLSAGIWKGQEIALEWTGTNAGELVDDSAAGSGNHRLSATWTPTQYDTLTLIWNGTDWVELSRSAN